MEPWKDTTWKVRHEDDGGRGEGLLRKVGRVGQAIGDLEDGWQEITDAYTRREREKNEKKTQSQAAQVHRTNPSAPSTVTTPAVHPQVDASRSN